MPVAATASSAGTVSPGMLPHTVARCIAASDGFEAQLAAAANASPGSDVAGALSGYLTTFRKHLAAFKNLSSSCADAKRRAEKHSRDIEARLKSSQTELDKLRDENRKLKWKSSAGGVSSKLLRGAMEGQKKTLEDVAMEAIAERDALKSARDETLKRSRELEKDLQKAQQSLATLGELRAAQAAELEQLRTTQKTMHRQVDETAMKALRKALNDMQQTMVHQKEDKEAALAKVTALERAGQRKDEDKAKMQAKLEGKIKELELELAHAQTLIQKHVYPQEDHVAEYSALSSGEHPATAGPGQGAGAAGDGLGTPLPIVTEA